MAKTVHTQTEPNEQLEAALVAKTVHTQTEPHGQLEAALVAKTVHTQTEPNGQLEAALVASPVAGGSWWRMSVRLNTILVSVSVLACAILVSLHAKLQERRISELASDLDVLKAQLYKAEAEAAVRASCS